MSPIAPLVSIGMPAFNCAETLAVAIRSILRQNYENWELLVMEDGSSDRTLEVARGFSEPRVRVCSDGLHEGIVPRLNQAVWRSRGEYFARMDADDIAYPERLERQVEYLQQHTEVDLLGCPMLMFKEDGVAFGCRPLPECHEEICRQPSSGFRIAHATLMGRVSWFRAHAYDRGAPRAEDYDLFLRSYTTSRFACLPDILYGCREERLLLRKILVGRYGVTKAAAREFASRRKYFTAAGAVLKQFAKAHVDVFAVLTGLDYRVLAHRARPLHADDLQRWTEVWRELQHEAEGRARQGKLLREPALNGPHLHHGTDGTAKAVP
jgi:glycosyltransferase involved in cell wall biosynthesis